MIVTAALAAQLAGTLVLTDTSRADVRWTYPLTVIQVPHEEVVIACDVATVPAARMTLRGRRLTLLMTYSPTITAADLELQEPVQVFQLGSVAATWRERTFSVMVSESGSYGQYNPTLLYGGQTSVGVPVTGGATTGGPGTAAGTTPMGGATTTPGAAATTAPTLITAVSSTSTALVRVQADRQTTVTLSGGYAVGGGLGAESIAYLPELYGPFASAMVLYRITAHQSLATVATAQEDNSYGACPGAVPNALGLTPNCRINASTSILEETYQQAISSRERFSVGLGIGVTTVQPSGTEGIAGVIPDELALLPYAEGSYFYNLDGRGLLRLSGQLQPAVDPRTGLPSERATEALTVTNALTTTWSTITTATALQSLPFPGSEPYSATAFSAGVEARKRLNAQLILLAGITGFWQAQVGYTSVGSVMAYVGVTAALPTMRF
jgi:hypothetical protein